MCAERNGAGFSQYGLAEKIGICAGKYIGKIERGETSPTLITMVVIMCTLNIDFDKQYEINEENKIPLIRQRVIYKSFFSY